MNDSHTDLNARLVQQAAQGDPQAFADLFEEHFQAVYNYAVTLAYDQDWAEDLTQDAFIRAHANLKRLGPPYNFRAWVFRIVHNRFIDETRQNRDMIDSADQIENIRDPNNDPERAASQGDIAARVRKTLEKLAPQYREVLLLREFHKYAYNEIAEIMETTIDYVKVLLHRARNKFQEAYGIRLLLEETSTECSTMGELIGVIHDNEADSAQDRLVRQHVKDCEYCQERQRNLLSVSTIFSAFIPLIPPAGLGPRILKRTGTTQRLRRRKRWRNARPKVLAGGGVAIVASTIVLGVIAALQSNLFAAIFDPPPPPPPVAPVEAPEETEEEAVEALFITETPLSTAALEGTPENSENVSPPLPPDGGDEPADDDDEVLGTAEEDTTCYSGPGLQWGIVNTLTAGTQIKIVGEGFNVPYYVGPHPDIENVNCWLIAGDISLDEDNPVLPYIFIPPKPTTTPTVTPDDPRQPGDDPQPTDCAIDQQQYCP
ncbi:MAG: RNA polymerase sigma factor [Chloroflexi bacterium]|nr:RNA polymerase sigma factor [Chloroflexota bacterium]